MNVDRKNKILITASTFPRWTEDSEPPFILDMAKALTNDYRVYVLVPHAQGAKKEEIWDDVTIKRFSYFIPYRWQKLCYGGGIYANLLKNKLTYFLIPFLLFFGCIAVLKIVRKEKIDLLYANWILPQGLIAILIKRIIKIPVVVNVLGGDIGLKNRYSRRVVKFVLNRADYIVGLTEAIKTEILKLKIKNEKIRVIPLGLHTRFFNPALRSEEFRRKYIADEGILLLFVGRLVEKKGVEYLIRAMPLITEKFDQVFLLIYGNGLLRAKLQQLTSELGMEAHIFFAGDIDNKKLPVIYASADIFIGPSVIPESGDLEGQGVVFLEALASGCCTIGTNIGGIPMSIIHEETGLLIEQKKYDEISRAVIRIRENESLKKRLQINGRDHVIRQFDWEKIGKLYQELFTELLDK